MTYIGALCDGCNRRFDYEPGEPTRCPACLPQVGSVVHLPDKGGNPPFGARTLNVSGKVLEVAGDLAYVRWDRGPDLSRCGVGGGWYEVEELRVSGE